MLKLPITITKQLVSGYPTKFSRSAPHWYWTQYAIILDSSIILSKTVVATVNHALESLAPIEIHDSHVAA